MLVTRFRPDTHHTEVLARGWGRLIIFFAGVHNTIEGLENVDRRQSYVFVSNHLSNLDAPYHLATMPVGVRFLAKKELYKVPLFGPTLRAVGMVETDRPGPLRRRPPGLSTSRWPGSSPWDGRC